LRRLAAASLPGVLLAVDDRLPDGSSASQLALAAVQRALPDGTLDSSLP
jgi:hypothetical protein